MIKTTVMEFNTRFAEIGKFHRVNPLYWVTKTYSWDAV